MDIYDIEDININHNSSDPRTLKFSELVSAPQIVSTEIPTHSHWKPSNLEMASLTVNALFSLSLSVRNEMIHAILALASTYLVM